MKILIYFCKLKRKWKQIFPLNTENIHKIQFMAQRKINKKSILTRKKLPASRESLKGCLNFKPLRSGKYLENFKITEVTVCWLITENTLAFVFEASRRNMQ